MSAHSCYPVKVGSIAQLSATIWFNTTTGWNWYQETKPARPHNDRLLLCHSEGKAAPPVGVWWHRFWVWLPSSSALCLDKGDGEICQRLLASCLVKQLRADTPRTSSNLHFSAIACACDKFFSLCATTPKAKGNTLPHGWGSTRWALPYIMWWWWVHRVQGTTFASWLHRPFTWAVMCVLIMRVTCCDCQRSKTTYCWGACLCWCLLKRLLLNQGCTLSSIVLFVCQCDGWQQWLQSLESGVGGQYQIVTLLILYVKGWWISLTTQVKYSTRILWWICFTNMFILSHHSWKTGGTCSRKWEWC